MAEGLEGPLHLCQDGSTGQKSNPEVLPSQQRLGVLIVSKWVEDIP